MGQMHIFAYFLHICALFFSYLCIIMPMHILAYMHILEMHIQFCIFHYFICAYSAYILQFGTAYSYIF